MTWGSRSVTLSEIDCRSVVHCDHSVVINEADRHDLGGHHALVTEGAIAGATYRGAADDLRLSRPAKGDENDLRDLTSLAVQGDPAAVESLIGRVRPMIVRYCRARLGRVSGQYHIADDVAQEVCIAVLARCPAIATWGGRSPRSSSASRHTRSLTRCGVPSVPPCRPRTCPTGPTNGRGRKRPSSATSRPSGPAGCSTRLPDHQRELVLFRVVAGSVRGGDR